MRSNAVDAALRARAAEVIPGGMYGHESVGMLPAEFPQFFARAQGARLWDADGNGYVDLMCAYGPNLLGYADPEIDAAYVGQLARGDTMTGPSPKMVELAEALVRQVAHARWAMFCRNGTDATSMGGARRPGAHRAAHDPGRPRRVPRLGRAVHAGAGRFAARGPRARRELRARRRREPARGGRRRPRATSPGCWCRRSGTTRSSTRRCRTVRSRTRCARSATAATAC